MNTQGLAKAHGNEMAFDNDIEHTATDDTKTLTEVKAGKSI